MVNKAHLKVSVVLKPVGKLKPKSSVGTSLKSQFDKAVDASTKLTSSMTAAKHSVKFEFDGDLHLECVGTSLKGKMLTALSELPKGVFATGEMKVATEVRNQAKIDEDIDFVVDWMAKEFKTKVVPQFEKRVP